MLKGALSGLAATYLMNQTTTWLYEREAPDARAREDAARGGQSAYVNMAESLAGVLGVRLGDDEKNRAGTIIHWSTGIVAGIKYAVLRRFRPELTAGYGLAYGLGFYLVLDELMNPLLGFTPGPAAFPWQAHARGLAGHLVYGASNDAALRLLDRSTAV
jgi:hypothetical protein